MEFGRSWGPEFLLCVSLGSQTPSEMTTHDSAPTFTSGVNLVLVQVVVRDGSGKAVGNLKREEFQLFDKGKPQFISKFAVERPGAPLAAPNRTAEIDVDGNVKVPESGETGGPIANRVVA